MLVSSSNRQMGSNLSMFSKSSSQQQKTKPSTRPSFIASELRLHSTSSDYSYMAVVINQDNKDWDCTKETMDAYCTEVCKLEKHFQGLEIHHVV